MYDWWFGWQTTKSARYKLWNPVAHQYAYRKPDSEEWSNKTYAGRYWGMVSWIDEFVGNYAAKLSIEFIPPSELGVDTTKTMVIGKIFLGEYVSEGFGSIPYLIPQVRHKSDGYRELRSLLLDCS
ncbi:uncharacterized protein P174DRAFT_435873 [Aspergillus novofumigatus IBT 16806]|uniref:DAPG hydrolase PhiG domain-containing protein n=1 Tax=Aspergillus novofumigatus (strain IBT 16806) TaxID=1392255 RepID=A0A2I1BTG3_ASPN1|nr:uncharacterized protein P174DRAFT_435873 [Aspergillus novofumigatus IBT 16806]PKX88688.1 hypothetical protein P174DRAFT_435873 [Aspergillus novofumigatus IBT 16806]